MTDIRQKRKGEKRMTKGKIPTVQEYQNTNYCPSVAFTEALRHCEAQLKDIKYRLGELAVHRAMYMDWSRVETWAFVQEYVELAQDLKAINDKWATRLDAELSEKG